MRISHAAQAAGCSVRAVRHYHSSGALPEPERLVNGYRDYTISDLTALIRVRSLVAAGVTLAEIRNDSASLIDAALTRLRIRQDQLNKQREQLERIRNNELGVPSDIRSDIQALLGKTCFADLEINSLELMGVTGVATPQTWDVIRTNLADPAHREATLQAATLWSSLGKVSPSSPDADHLIAELKELTGQGMTAGIMPTLVPGGVPLTVNDVTEFIGAQERALKELSGQ